MIEAERIAQEAAVRSVDARPQWSRPMIEAESVEQWEEVR